MKRVLSLILISIFFVNVISAASYIDSVNISSGESQSISTAVNWTHSFSGKVFAGFSIEPPLNESNTGSGPWSFDGNLGDEEYTGPLLLETEISDQDSIHGVMPSDENGVTPLYIWFFAYGARGSLTVSIAQMTSNDSLHGPIGWSITGVDQSGKENAADSISLNMTDSSAEIYSDDTTNYIDNEGWFWDTDYLRTSDFAYWKINSITTDAIKFDETVNTGLTYSGAITLTYTST